MGKVRKEQEEIEQKKREERRLKAKEYQETKQRIDALITNREEHDLERLVQEKDVIAEKIQHSSFSKAELSTLEGKCKLLTDAITEKQEEVLISETFSDDKREKIAQLKTVLEQRQQRRKEIKQQLELYRKESGISGLDFEKAMQYNKKINEEKERLEKINGKISEVEQQIATLKDG